MAEFERFTNAKSAPGLQRVEVLAGPLTRELFGVIGYLNADEMRVLLEIAKRLRMGQEQYGALDIADDPRDFVKEAHEEFLDAAVYLAIRTLTRGPIEKGTDDANAGNATNR